MLFYERVRPHAKDFTGKVVQRTRGVRHDTHSTKRQNAHSNEMSVTICTPQRKPRERLKAKQIEKRRSERVKSHADMYTEPNETATARDTVPDGLETQGRREIYGNHTTGGQT